MSNDNNRYNNQQNMVKPSTIAPKPTQVTVRPMSQEETGIMDRIAQAIHLPPAPGKADYSSNHTGHSKEAFNLKDMAEVATKFGKQDVFIIGAITLSITLLLFYIVPGDAVLYGIGWLVLFGSASLYAMNRTRKQAYTHSPTGIALHESDNAVTMHGTDAEVEIHRIDAAKEVALGVAKMHADLLRDRWRLESGQADSTKRLTGGTDE